MSSDADAVVRSLLDLRTWVAFDVDDAVFVGDALTTRHVLTGRTGARPAPFTDEPEEALAPLGRLAGVSASWAHPGTAPRGTGRPGDIATTVRAT